MAPAAVNGVDDVEKTVPIAVVGIGCRFPGQATDPKAFWDMLVQEQSAHSDFPSDRLNINGFYHPSGDRQGTFWFRSGHFLAGDIAAFDAPFFSMASNEAKAVDPQQRLLLEVSYEALENAGIPKEDLNLSPTGVWCGSFVKDYEQVCLRDPEDSPQYAATGNGTAIMSNRISYVFNLRGPSMTIDTGCSASLVCLHQACQSLATGETTLGIVAGAGMILTPSTMMPMTALGFLSPDGKCFSFDARANGYGRGEGVGVIILKRLDKALQDNDTIRAVIRGTRVNQDGKTNGITLPSKEAQVENIRGVYDFAGLSVDDTAYVECHGTGTKAGDWREANAISESLCKDRKSNNPLLIGSVKTNIGHLEGAAGVAGIIKGVMMLENGKIPRHLNFEAPGNPEIDFAELKVKIPTTLLPWPDKKTMRLGVNSFGFGGTNAHVILDSAHSYLSRRKLKGNHNCDNAIVTKNVHSTGTTSSAQRPRLFVYSSHEASGVARAMESHLQYLRSRSDDDHTTMADYAYTLLCRRSKLEWKVFVVAQSRAELSQKLEDVKALRMTRSALDKEPRVALVFCGQGAQWHAMGRELLQYPVFRDTVAVASNFIRDTLNSDFDLSEELTKDKDSSHIDLPEIAQPATTVLQLALVNLIRSSKISPAAVVGHSSGEIAAAYAIGALSLQDACKIAFYRGQCAASLKRVAPHLDGRMLAVALSAEAAQKYVTQVQSGTLVVACHNSESNVTLSGDKLAIEQVSEILRAAKIQQKLLPVTTAYHSPHMQVVESQYRSAISGISPLPPIEGPRMYSSVSGGVVEVKDLNAEYWIRNLVSPVLFDVAMGALLANHMPHITVEVGPTAALRLPIQQTVGSSGCEKKVQIYLSLLERGKGAGMTMLETMGELWTRGCQVDMSWAFLSDATLPKTLVDLPTYPWNRSHRYWHESHLSTAHRFRRYPRQDLIGAPTADSTPLEPRWRGFLRLSENPWLSDHQVQKTIIYPAAGMVVMGVEAAKQMADPSKSLLGVDVSQMTIHTAMLIPSTPHGLEYAVNGKQKMLGNFAASYEFSIYSKAIDRPWVSHASGTVTIRYEQTEAEEMALQASEHRRRYSNIKSTCNDELQPRQLYEHLDVVGMNYGPLFQNIVEITKGENACHSIIRIPDTKSKMPATFEFPHIIHPATLDSVFQTVFAVGDEAMVPSTIQSVFISAKTPQGAGRNLTGYATAERRGFREATADIAMFDEARDPCVVIKGLSLTAVNSSQDSLFLPNHRNLCSEVVWKRDVDSIETNDAREWLDLIGHKYPNLSILQINGSKETSTIILDVLGSSPEAPRLSRFTICDDSSSASDRVMAAGGTEKFGPLVEHRMRSALEEATYDIIISPGDIDWQLLRTALKSGGTFVVTADQQHSNEAVMPAAEKTLVLETTSEKMSWEIVPSRGPKSHEQIAREVLILRPDQPPRDVQDILVALTTLLAGHGIKFKLATLSQASDEPVKNPIASFLDLEKFEPLTFNLDKAKFDSLQSLLMSTKHLLWITRGAQMLTESPLTAVFTGLARTIHSEDAQKNIVTLDLDGYHFADPVKSAQAVFSVLHGSLASGQRSLSEMEYAERSGELYIPRLMLLSEINNVIEQGVSKARSITHLPLSETKRDLRLEIGVLGRLDSLYFEDDIHSKGLLGPTELRVRVETCGLYPQDLNTIHGNTGETTLGSDFTGIISELGTNVTGFNVGDHVMGLARGAVKTSIRVDQKFVRSCSRVENGSAFPDKLTGLAALVTAYHGLYEVGTIGSGGSIFVNAAAGAFGQAAVAIATKLGAMILAGVSNDEQRKILQEQYGLIDEHILDMGDSSFVQKVLRLTSGDGVEVFYNPISEDMELHLQCIADSGKLFQLADKSLNHSSVQMPRRNIGFEVFDLWSTVKKRPQLITVALDSVLDLLRVKAGMQWPPAPANAYHFGDVTKAFTDLIQDPNLGSFCLTSNNDSVVPVATKLFNKVELRKDATYILVGGLGGLGRSVAGLLAAKGAKHIAFFSRSGAKNKESQELLVNLRAMGVDARPYAVDICDDQELHRVISQVESDMPKIKGAIQGAAVLKDAIFEKMTFDDWSTAIRPKTVGSWNLHRSLPKDMDFLLFLSSSAGVIGNRGQANYASGNCFQDALARHRSALCMPSVSIDLGPVIGAGMVAEDEMTLNILRSSGFFGIRLEHVHFLIERAMSGFAVSDKKVPPQIVTCVGTGGLTVQNNVQDPYWSTTGMFAFLNQVDLPPRDFDSNEPAAGKDSVKAALNGASTVHEATGIICTGLLRTLAEIKGLSPTEMDGSRSAQDYAIDSLMAVNIANWVFRETGAKVSVFEVLGNDSIMDLSRKIAGKSGFGGEEE